VNYQERWNDEQRALKIALDARLARVWTALPGIVQAVSADGTTVSVQPAVNGTMTVNPPGTATITVTHPKLPLLTEVPLHHPAGGGVLLTFPVKTGDECLLVFSSRSIDAWWANGGVQDPLDARSHDLSDAFAFVGFNSQATVPTAISSTATQLRSTDGTVNLTLDPTVPLISLNAGANAIVVNKATNVVTVSAEQTVNVLGSSQVTVNAPTIALQGSVEVTGVLSVNGVVVAVP